MPTDYIDFDQVFFQNEAKYQLARFGNKNPTKRQGQEMADLLSNVWLRRRIGFHGRLTGQERRCLYYARQGKSIKETARRLGCTPGTVTGYRALILQKLKCKKIGEAIAKGIRYGYLDENACNDSPIPDRRSRDKQRT